MRLLSVLAVLAACSVLGSAHAQEQPFVTTVVTGPGAVSPGSQATYNIDATVTGGAVGDFYITWYSSTPTGAADVCCDYVSSSVRSGQATLDAPPAAGSMRWSVYAPGARLELVLGVHSTVDTDTVTVSTYLPGTDVAQYETVTPAVSRVVRLPQTGGPPPAPAGSARDLVLAGAVLLLASAACVVGAQRVRTGEMS